MRGYFFSDTIFYCRRGGLLRPHKRGTIATVFNLMKRYTISGKSIILTCKDIDVKVTFKKLQLKPLSLFCLLSL
jgi:hypothetical protein